MPRRKMCMKCKCRTGSYHLIYDIPDTNKKKDLTLCRSCQMMMVNLMDYAQGLQSEEDS